MENTGNIGQLLYIIIYLFFLLLFFKSVKFSFFAITYQSVKQRLRGFGDATKTNRRHKQTVWTRLRQDNHTIIFLFVFLYLKQINCVLSSSAASRTICHLSLVKSLDCNLVSEKRLSPNRYITSNANHTCRPLWQNAGSKRRLDMETR